MRKFVFVMEQMLGHAVHMANLEREIGLETDISATIIRVAPERSSWPGRIPGLRSWSFQASRAARAAVQRRLAQGTADALFIHTQVAALLSVGVMRAIPTIVSLDATPLNYDSVGASYGHSRSAAPLEWAKWQANHRAFSAARTLVSWSRWAADSLVHDYHVPAERVHVIRPGVDLCRFQPVERDDRDGPVRILFVGGDFTRKGGDDLLEAVRYLDGSVELDVVTSTHPRSCPAGPGIRIHVGVGHEAGRLHGLYRRADIFALPSRGDCLPLVVAEALASGLPVVTSDVGALSEVVRDGWNGFLVPPARPDRLTTALRALVESPDLRRTMGARGRRMACEEHDAGRNNRTILDLMRQMSRTDGEHTDTGPYPTPSRRDLTASARAFQSSRSCGEGPSPRVARSTRPRPF
jgi:glycosyltransferase involved in cell wall biosynthesis